MSEPNLKKLRQLVAGSVLFFFQLREVFRHGIVFRTLSFLCNMFAFVVSLTRV